MKPLHAHTLRRFTQPQNSNTSDKQKEQTRREWNHFQSATEVTISTKPQFWTRYHQLNADHQASKIAVVGKPPQKKSVCAFFVRALSVHYLRIIWVCMCAAVFTCTYNLFYSLSHDHGLITTESKQAIRQRFSRTRVQTGGMDPI